MEATCDYNVVGQCLEMCPKLERLEREKNRRLSIFETMPQPHSEKGSQPKANPLTCVTEYSRSAAGRRIDVKALRPAKILIRTMNFLVDEIIDIEKHGRTWIEVYDFVSDRIRAIVQEMIIQRIDACTSVELLQKAVRFHIIFMYTLQSDEGFNRKLCFEQLCSYLASLLKFYGGKYDCRSFAKSRDEFIGYQLLIHFHSDQALQCALAHISTSIVEAQQSTKLRFANCHQNFVLLFRIAEKLPYMSSCCFYQHVNALRISAFRIMANAYSGKNIHFPLSKLVDWLKFDSLQHAHDFCKQLAISIIDGFILFNKNTKFPSESLRNIEKEFNRSVCLVDGKQKHSIRYYIMNNESEEK